MITTKMMVVLQVIITLVAIVAEGLPIEYDAAQQRLVVVNEAPK